MKDILSNMQAEPFLHQHDDCDCGHDHHEHDHENDHEHDHHDHEHEHHHHDHDDDCDCGCGHDHHDHEHDEHDHDHEHHDHDDDCDCGCGHEHHDHHDHDHDEHHHDHHHHDHDDDCGCGCGHDHHEHEHEHEHDHHHHDHDDTAAGKTIYILENLGCAHCASKMEEQIGRLPGVEAATITYATKQLRITADDPDALLPQIQKICTSIESEVKVVPRTKSVPSGFTTKTYILENLGCAHCASKMEDAIGNLDGVAEATITFATKQLRITAKEPDQYLDEVRKICTSIESEVTVTPKDAPEEKNAASEKDEAKKEKRELIGLIIGAVLFVAGLTMHHMEVYETASIVILVIAYILLGAKVLLNAAKNISHGQIFDENFLMSIATLGAFAIAEYPEAVGVMLFYRIGEYFEDKAVERSRGQIMDAVDMRPEVVTLIKSGGDTAVIPAENAKPGDILLIRPGDRIPLDGVITEGESRLDTSPITGEPVPVAVSAGDEITSGCVNTSGQLTMRVTKPLSESMVTRILDSVENAAASKPKIDRFITRFSHVYTPCVVLAALLIAIVPSLVGGNWNYWIYTALTFLVMSCPCALVLSVPLAFFSGIGAGSKKGILFKGGLSMEALKDVKAVIMDKTGTITEGNFQLQKVVPSGQIAEDELLAICAGCEQHSTHPIAASITAAARTKGLTLEVPEELSEIAGHGIVAATSRGQVLCGNRKLMDKYGVNMDNADQAAFGAEVFVAIDGVYAGMLTISDTIKEDAKSAISRLKALHLHTVMLTGDSQASAEAVAAETGIDEVHGKLLPQDKLSLLTKVREKYGTVMFIGDGINDAPVLAGADVGAAMGSGADAAIEAADAVFMTSSVESIPDAVNIAKQTGSIAVQNVVFALVIKAIVMVLGLAGHANMWLAVFADTGVAMLCVLNSIRILYKK